MADQTNPEDDAFQRQRVIALNATAGFVAYRDVLELAVNHLDIDGVTAVLAGVTQQIESMNEQLRSETDPVGSAEVPANSILVAAHEYLERTALILGHRVEVLNRHAQVHREVIVACPECYETYEIFKVVGDVECPGCGEHHYPAFIGHKKPPPHPRSGA